LRKIDDLPLGFVVDKRRTERGILCVHQLCCIASLNAVSDEVGIRTSPWPAAAGAITGATSTQSQSKFACGGTLLVHGLTTSTQKHQRKELEEVSSYVGIHFPVMFPFLTFSDGSKSG
jgi:hypothetical protein